MDHGICLMRILIARDKHETRYLNASTVEAWAASSLQLLRERLEQGWYWAPKDDEDGLGTSEWADRRRVEIAEAMALTDEQIEALPGRLRHEVLKERAQARQSIADAAHARAWVKEVTALVRNKDMAMVTVGRGRWERQEPKAWTYLYDRSDHEYEGVEVIDVEEPTA
jgi:hypothetical protein